MQQAVAGLILFEEKVLVGKKVTKENHLFNGCWHLPGGHMEDGEDEITALKREFKEETNLDIEVISKFASEVMGLNNTVIKWYLGKAVSTNLIAGDDLEEAKFVNKCEVFNLCKPEVIAFWPTEVKEYLESK